MIALEKILKAKLSYQGSYIDGQWAQPSNVSGNWEMVSPANVDWVLPSPVYSFEHVERALRSAEKAYASWSRLTLETRMEALRRFGEELGKRSDLIGRVISVETGKPLEEALGEAQLLENKIRVTLEEALPRVAVQSFEIPGQGLSEMAWKPLGTCLVIGPYNFPVHLSHGHLIPALLMGNVCILKPSEKAPYSAQVYMEAAHAAGLPLGVLQLVQGPAEVSVRLMSDPSVSCILATCSFDVGVKILKKCAETPRKLVAVEMGGKNAALVLKDADLERTAEALIRSAYLTTGQRCTAVSRVFVESSVLNALVEKVHERAKALVIAHPFEENPRPFMGPLISSEAREKFLRYMAIAESEGAESVMRAKALEGVTRQNRKPLPLGHYVSPSIHRVSAWNNKSAYQTHELFGPDLFFCPVESLEEGLACVNDSRYGLVASLFGGDEAIFHKFADEAECGLVYWNRPTVGASAKLPFGGWKDSGNHRPAGIFALMNAVRVQSRILG